VLFVKVCPIEFCPIFIAVCPDKFVLLAIVQVYVVPDGTISPLPFVGDWLNRVPEHDVLVVFELFAILGFGFTVTATVKVEPIHKPDCGVTVYVTTSCVFNVFVKG
jgi:hypothetical protein